MPAYNKQILLLEHFRHATRKWYWEIPRDFGSAVTPRETTWAELREELSAEPEPEKLTAPGTFHTDTGLGSQKVALFHAEIGRFALAERHEPIRDARPCHVHEVNQAIAENRIADSSTIVALARAALAGIL